MAATKMTRVQALDECARLRLECDRLETENARHCAQYAELRTRAEAAYVAVRTERNEAVEALHALRAELLASRLPKSVRPIEVKGRWIDRNGNTFERHVQYLGGRQITTNVLVPA